MFSFFKFLSGAFGGGSLEDAAVQNLVSAEWLSPSDLDSQDLTGRFILVKAVAGVNSHNRLRADIIKSHAIGFIEVRVVENLLRPVMELLLAKPESLPERGIEMHARVNTKSESEGSAARRTQSVSNNLVFSIADDVASVQRIDREVCERAAAEQAVFDKQLAERVARRRKGDSPL